jgi:hypothetical protein
MLFQADKFFEKVERQAFLTRLFRRIFLDDWWIKLVALIITLALWLGVSGLRSIKTERLRSVALNIRVSNDIEVTNSPVTEIDLVVTGDKGKIDQLNPRDLIASLDLSEVQAGERTVQITPENIVVDLPTGVKLDEIQPNKIAVKLERVEERDITVKIETEGSVADGFEIYSAVVSPPKVRVRGPESYIKSLDSILTEKINIDDRQRDFTAQQVSLNVVNPKATLLDAGVDVAFRIGEKRLERLFLVPVQSENGEKRVQVVLYGEPSLLAGLRTDQIQIELVKADSGELSANVILPPEIEGRVEIRKNKVNL